MNDFIEIKTRINTLLDELASRREPGTPAGSGEWSPRVDMYDLPDRIVLRADGALEMAAGRLKDTGTTVGDVIEFPED